MDQILPFSSGYSFSQPPKIFIKSSICLSFEIPLLRYTKYVLEHIIPASLPVQASVPSSFNSEYVQLSP